MNITLHNLDDLWIVKSIEKNKRINSENNLLRPTIIHGSGLNQNLILPKTLELPFSNQTVSSMYSIIFKDYPTKDHALSMRLNSAFDTINSGLLSLPYKGIFDIINTNNSLASTAMVIQYGKSTLKNIEYLMQSMEEFVKKS